MEDKDGALIIDTEVTRSLYAINAIRGVKWNYDLLAIVAEWGAGDGLSELMTSPDLRADSDFRRPIGIWHLQTLKNFECMHTTRDIVMAVYGQTEDDHCGAYIAEKVATFERRGLLGWYAELDMGNSERLALLVNLYARACPPFRSEK